MNRHTLACVLHVGRPGREGTLNGHMKKRAGKIHELLRVGGESSSSIILSKYYLTLFSYDILRYRFTV